MANEIETEIATESRASENSGNRNTIDCASENPENRNTIDRTRTTPLEALQKLKKNAPCTWIPVWLCKLIGILIVFQFLYYIYHIYSDATLPPSHYQESSTRFSIDTEEDHKPATFLAYPQTERLVATTLSADSEREEEPKELDLILAHLHRYGYLTKERAKLGRKLPAKDFRAALFEYQRFMGIPATGILDDATSDHISTARCGNKDLDSEELLEARRDLELEADHRSKRYTLMSEKWPKRLITYRILNYPTSKKITRQKVELEFARAFTAWSKVVPLRFNKKGQGKVDISIKFAKGDHDNCPLGEFEKSINGRNDAFAHAFGPGQEDSSGDIHINDHFTWAEDSSEGQTLYTVALHEIGHSLGLMHSDYDHAIMYPLERAKGVLHADDLAGIQAIYGKKSKTAQSRKNTEDEDSKGTEDKFTTIPDSAADEDYVPEEEIETPKIAKAESKKPTCGDGGRWLFPGPDCKQFYDCRSGSLKLRECPGILVWNKAKNLCDFRHNVPDCHQAYSNQD